MNEIILAILDMAIVDRELFEAWHLKNEAVRDQRFDDAVKFRELETAAMRRLPTAVDLKALRQKFLDANNQTSNNG